MIQASGQESVADIEKLFEIRKKFRARVQDAIKNLPPLTIIPSIIPSTMDHPGWPPPPPASKDPTFWWAETDAGVSPQTFTSNFDENGDLHFGSGVATWGGDLHMFSFGAVAVFELQWERVPPSPSGRWKSAPFVELFGSITANTDSGSGFLNLADSWSKCTMFRRQTIRQGNPLSSDFGFFIMLGHREEEEKLIDEENKDRWITHNMPGFQWMPEVIFNSPIAGSSLWAELEVRFDIQVEDGLLSLEPGVLLHTVQWPLEAI